MSQAFKEVRIVIDGLDECGDLTGLVCHWLERLLCADGTNISFALLSRDEHEIRDVFGSPVCSHVEVAAHTEDIEHHVRAKLKSESKQEVFASKIFLNS